MEGLAACGGQLRSRQPVCLSQPLALPSGQRLCVLLSWEGGVRLRALSDELSDNEFAPHGALGLRGKCFGEMQLGFHQPLPPDSTKIVRARPALTHRPGPISPPPVLERGSEWPLFLNLGLSNLALLFLVACLWTGLVCLVLEGFAPS